MQASTLQIVALLQECIIRLLYFTNGTKSCKACQLYVGHSLCFLHLCDLCYIISVLHLYKRIIFFCCLQTIIDNWRWSIEIGVLSIEYFVNLWTVWKVEDHVFYFMLGFVIFQVFTMNFCKLLNKTDFKIGLVAPVI